MCNCTLKTAFPGVRGLRVWLFLFAFVYIFVIATETATRSLGRIYLHFLRVDAGMQGFYLG